MRASALHLLVLLAGCSGGAHRLVDRFEEPPAMQAAILALTPRGTPLPVVAARLGAEGFRCHAPARDVFAGLRDSLTFAYCDGRADAGPFIVRRWQLALVDSAGRLAAVHATTGLIGP